MSDLVQVQSQFVTIRRRIRSQVSGQVWDQVWDPILDPILGRVWGQVRDQIEEEAAVAQYSGSAGVVEDAQSVHLREE